MRSTFLSTLSTIVLSIGLLSFSANTVSAQDPHGGILVQRIGNELVITGTTGDDRILYALDGSQNNIELYVGPNSGLANRTPFFGSYPVADGGIFKIRFYGDAGADFFAPHEVPPSGSTKVRPRDQFEKRIPQMELYGGRGRDFLEGGSYDDIIVGGEGRDTIQGNGGKDLLVGGLGRDWVHADTSRIDCVEREEGDIPFGTPGYTYDIIFQPNPHTQVLEYEMPSELYGDWNGDGTIDRGYYIRDARDHTNFRQSNDVKGLFVLPEGDRAFNEFFQPINSTYTLFGGFPADWPIVGNWEGNRISGYGVDRPGVFRSGVFYMDIGNPGWNGEGPEEFGVPFGLPGDFPVVGDFHSQNFDRVGVWRSGQFHLDIYELGFPAAPVAPDGLELPGIQFGGLPGDSPAVGDWNGDGFADAGIFRSGPFATDVAIWRLDDSKRGYQFDGPADFERVGVPFGFSDERPVVWNFDKLPGDDLATVAKDGRWRVHLLGN